MTLPELTADFVDRLIATKDSFLLPSTEDARFRLRQCGARSVPALGRPTWPRQAPANGGEVVASIETFVIDGDGHVTPTGSDHTTIESWTPLAQWMGLIVAETLAGHGARLKGDGYLTASWTPVAEHEGTPHIDDTIYDPAEPAGFVATVGEHVGPRIARDPIPIEPPRPSSPIEVPATTLRAFIDRRLGIVDVDGDDLVIFPQFGQLHAGPAAVELAPATTGRGLLVFRGIAVPDHAT